MQSDLPEVTQVASIQLLCELWKSASEVKILNHYSLSLLKEERLKRKYNRQPKEEIHCQEHSASRKEQKRVEKSTTSPQHLIYFLRTNHTMGFPSAQKANNITYGQGVADNGFSGKYEVLSKILNISPTSQVLTATNAADRTWD